MPNPDPMSAERLAEIKASPRYSSACPCDTCKIIGDLLAERDWLLARIAALRDALASIQRHSPNDRAVDALAADDKAQGEPDAH